MAAGLHGRLLAVTAKDDVDGSGFGAGFHDGFDDGGVRGGGGADVDAEGRIGVEATLEVGAKLANVDWFVAGEDLALAVQIEDFPTTDVLGSHGGGSRRELDLHFELLAGDLGRDHEKNEQQKSHVDHGGELKPHLDVFVALGLHG